MQHSQKKTDLHPIFTEALFTRITSQNQLRVPQVQEEVKQTLVCRHMHWNAIQSPNRQMRDSALKKVIQVWEDKNRTSSLRFEIL